MEGGLRSPSLPGAMTVEQELSDASQSFGEKNSQQPDTGRNSPHEGPTEAPPRVMVSITGKVGRGQGALRN